MTEKDLEIRNLPTKLISPQKISEPKKPPTPSKNK